MTWTAACLLLIPSTNSFCISIVITRRSALHWPTVARSAYTWLKKMALCSRTWLCQEMSSLEVQIVMQKPSPHAGRSSDTVGCISGVLFVLWALYQGLMRKKMIPPPHTHTPNGSLGNKSPKVAMTCQFGITLLTKYISMCPGRKEPSFGLVILHWYTNSQPAPCSCLFSRPDDPRSSALIGLWNVDKALPAPRHACLHYNLFVFLFSLQCWKVGKKSSHLARRPPRETQDLHKFSIRRGSNILWGSAHENQLDRVTNAWS